MTGKDRSESKNEIRKVGLLSILGYIFGTLFVLYGVIGLTKSFIGGTIIIFAGLLLIPKFNQFIREKYKIELSTNLRVAGFIILFLIGSWLIPSNNSLSEGLTPITGNSANPIVVTDAAAIFPDASSIPSQLKISQGETTSFEQGYFSPDSNNHALGKYFSSSSQRYSITKGFYDAQTLAVSIYLYDSSESAKAAYYGAVSKVKGTRGYTEENAGEPNCFAYSIEVDSLYGTLARWFGKCLHGNVYFEVIGARTGNSFDPMHPKELIRLVNTKIAQYVPLEQKYAEGKLTKEEYIKQKADIEQKSAANAGVSTVPKTEFSWNEFLWNPTETNGITISDTNQSVLTIEGTANGSIWNSESRLSKNFNNAFAQVEMALADLPSSAAGASIWFTKDSQNALIVEKHRDITDPQYNTNVFIVEKINGANSFKYVSPDVPSANFDTYKIKKIFSGYEVYYNGALVYTGNLDLTAYNKVELVGIARASGDQVEAKFRSYKEQ